VAGAATCGVCALQPARRIQAARSLFGIGKPPDEKASSLLRAGATRIARLVDCRRPAFP
jgi:hypothetical protein